MALELMDPQESLGGALAPQIHNYYETVSRVPWRRTEGLGDPANQYYPRFRTLGSSSCTPQVPPQSSCAPVASRGRPRTPGSMQAAHPRWCGGGGDPGRPDPSPRAWILQAATRIPLGATYVTMNIIIFAVSDTSCHSSKFLSGENALGGNPYRIF